MEYPRSSGSVKELTGLTEARSSNRSRARSWYSELRDFSGERLIVVDAGHKGAGIRDWWQISCEDRFSLYDIGSVVSRL